MKTTAMATVVWRLRSVSHSRKSPSCGNTAPRHTDLRLSCRQSTVSPDRPACDPVATATAADANANPFMAASGITISKPRPVLELFRAECLIEQLDKKSSKRPDGFIWQLL